MKTAYPVILLLAFNALGALSHTHASAVVVSKAQVAETPPNSRVSAAYFELHNQSKQAVTLVKVVSPQFERTEIHETRVEQGMARMIAIPRLALAPNQRQIFQAGGLHLMLINPRTPLKAGDSVALTFSWSNNQVTQTSAPVRRMDDAHSHDHHHH